ncbi:hypothetical protein XELAEV_18016960mg, partial [Xenopus laevis]
MGSFLFLSRLRGGGSRALIPVSCSRVLSKMTSEAYFLTPEERTQGLQELQALGWTEVGTKDAIYKEYKFKSFNQLSLAPKMQISRRRHQDARRRTPASLEQEPGSACMRTAIRGERGWE